jgi:5-formyltetrahydrofolate cyclo-ligase
LAGNFDNPEQRLQNLKTALRQEIRARLKSKTAAERTSASAAACCLLQEQPAWKSAQSILFFAPLPEELDVWPLLSAALSAGKIIALPRFDEDAGHYVACQVRNLADDLKPGQFGIREPGDRCAALIVNRLDLVLVPGIAFDLQGRRLGRGKGFYDQLLAFVRGTTCGVAFDEQIVEVVPVELHDVHLNCILTPTRWIEP